MTFESRGELASGSVRTGGGVKRNRYWPRKKTKKSLFGSLAFLMRTSSCHSSVFPWDLRNGSSGCSSHFSPSLSRLHSFSPPWVMPCLIVVVAAAMQPCLWPHTTNALWVQIKQMQKRYLFHDLQGNNILSPASLAGG